ncbi:MAG: VanW family protein [Anaerolineae bacterium]
MSQSSQVLPAKTTRIAMPNVVLGMIILLGSLLVALIFGLLAYQVYFLQRAHLGVQIGGVDVGQMTRPQVEQVVAQQAAELLNRPLTLTSPAGTAALTAAELGARIDIERTVNMAFSVGRQGPFFSDLRTQWHTARRPVSIVPVITFDTGPANAVLRNLAHTLDHPPRDAQLAVRPDATLDVTLPQEGQSVDVTANRDAIRRAILTRNQTPIPLVITTTPPRITELEPARSRLEAFLSQPLVFTFRQQSWSLSPGELAKMVIVGQEQAADRPGNVTATFNQAALAAYFHNLALEINQPARNAWFHLDVSNWTFIPIVESQNGQTLDVAAAVTAVTGLLQTPNQHQLELPVLVQPPAVPMETPEQLGITELVNSATSYFKGSSSGRMQNIQVSASKFHGLVIPPGGIFSFNEHLGDVTAANGFVESLIIEGDRTAVGIGGGVCQVSTTAFRAAFFAGFEIVERWAHGYRVSWYETGSGPGLDATIYSPDVDFKFKNDTDGYILIQTSTDLNAGTVTFNFYGAPSDRTVIVSEPVESNRVPHGPDIYQEDPTLKPGEIQQVDWAKDGVDVTVYRTVLKGETVIHQDTIFSRYRPWQNVFKIGPSPN